jgi:hypothetical protein
MAAVYDEALDCDMVQASHHGLNGATETLYKNITPSIVFWPIDTGRSTSVSGSNNDGWDNRANHAWLNDESIKHYYGDVTTTVKVTSTTNSLKVQNGAFDGFDDNSDEEMIWDWGV